MKPSKEEEIASLEAEFLIYNSQVNDLREEMNAKAAEIAKEYILREQALTEKLGIPFSLYASYVDIDREQLFRTMQESEQTVAGELGKKNAIFIPEAFIEKYKECSPSVLFGDYPVVGYWRSVEELQPGWASSSIRNC